MHRCLLIVEIVQNVCQSIDAESNSTSLATLARTCQIFHSLALDCLWASQNGLENVLTCMPPDLFESQAEDPFHDLRRPIAPSDWERPLIYTRRIRTLNAAASQRHISSRVFAALHASLPCDVQTAFPKLKSLDWVEPDFSGIRLLLTPKITDLFLCCEPDNARLSHLSLIPETCFALKNLSIHFPASPEFSGSSYSQLICSLPSRIQLLWIHIPDLRCLQHISRLPALAGFAGSLPTNLSSQFLGTTAPPLTFNTLRTLHLEKASSISTVTDFLRRASLPVLQSIRIEFDGGQREVAIEKLHAALRDACNATTLAEIILNFSDSNAPGAADQHLYRIGMPALKPLLGFANLISMNITSHLDFDLDDDEMKELAIAFPRLLTLRLKGGPCCKYRTPRLSLRAWAILAEHCPSLQYLDVSVDATTVPALDRGAENGKRVITQLALRDLGTDRSPIASPAINVARFINNIFPRLDSVTAYSDPLSRLDVEHIDIEVERAKDHEILWFEVEEQLNVLRAVREEERVLVREELGLDSEGAYYST
ncbi:hypothetical protein R3P38DRAFT_2616831 [Favolaschia claudopus]|uniref:F-box domain-containing protein n=1 Tax=Favolaschia claudopus TaxID=2862362 RepID=A0AAW0CDN0_9AGAR